jgi:hypothetical protein
METKKLDYEHDKKGFEEAQKLAVALRAQGEKKKEVLKKCENIYLMRGESITASKELRKAVSPDGKNKLKGARRLLSAAVPKFRVPREKNNAEVEEISSTLEQVAGVMWNMSNHIQGLRLESELALSGFLYDEMIVNVICLQDVVDNIEAAYADEEDKWEKARWEGRLKQAKNQAALTPYLIEAVSPMIYFPQYGRFGTSSVFSEMKRTIAEVKAAWGARALKAIGAKKDTDTVTECTVLDNTFKYVWLNENKGEPIFADVHGMAMMQTVAVRAAGSSLFSEAADQYDPFLKTMSESGLCELQDSILTALNTNLNATLEAQMIFTQGQANDDIVPMFDKFLGMWKLPPGSRLEWMVKDVLSRDIIGALELVRGINSESTIYDQALGAGSGKSDPYGLVSLLSQAGRLPLTDVQKMMGELGARTQEVAFSWWKANGKKSKLQAKYGQDLTLNPSDIPETIRFECIVDIDLPQDKLQMANTGAKFREMGASEEWVLTNFAGIENPDQMAKQSFIEQARKVAGQAKIEEIVRKLMTPAAPPTPPPAPPQMSTSGEGGTPEQMQMMQEQQMQQAQQMQGAGGMPPGVQTPRGMPTEADMQGGMPPMPPEMMQGGM